LSAREFEPVKAERKHLDEIEPSAQFHQHVFALLGFMPVKAEGEMLMKLTPGVNFTNVLHKAFTLVDPKSVKNAVKSSVFFYAFGIYGRKSCA